MSAVAERELTWDDVRVQLEGDYELWLATLLPSYFTQPLAPHHHDFWRWVWSIERGVPVDPFVGIWPRGGGKSVSAETALVALACRRRRGYALYVSRTLELAEKHLATVARIIESSNVGLVYEEVGRKAVGKFGHSKGWRRDRLTTASGFTIDALGLKEGVRGLKVEEQRPDVILLDDVDMNSDTLDTIRKNMDDITMAILPAGSRDVAVLAIQNLVHAQGVFAHLAGIADDQTEFLVRRHLSGPIKAIEGLAIDRVDGRLTITAGVPAWKGQDIAECQRVMDRTTKRAFLSECQHEVAPPLGGMYDDVEWRHCTHAEMLARTDLVTVCVWVDPAVTDTDRSDSNGIQCDALGDDDVIYRLASWERRSSPLGTLVKALEIAMRHGASTVGVETDQGRDNWRTTYAAAWDAFVAENPEHTGALCPEFAERQANSRDEATGSSRGSKTARSAKMLAEYEQPGRLVHVTTGPDGEIGTHAVLEAALARFPITKPYDLADAAYWAFHDLRVRGGRGASSPLVVRRGRSRWVA